MRRFIFLLIFVLSVSFTAGAEARKLALLVGVDEYINVPSLKCCVNDMKTLKEALMIIGFEEDDIQMLVTGGPYKGLPTKKNIEQKLSQIISGAQPGDMVFIAFSGHGAQEDSNVYFCPPDVEVGDLKGTCVSITKTMDLLAKKCKARFKWMVVDACRNDPSQSAKGIGGKGLQVVPTPPVGIALFQSCAEGEESWEDRESGNGYFTKNFAAALSGAADFDPDGQLTLFEVCKWTTAKTKEQVKNGQNKSQRPFFSGSVSDFTLTNNLNVTKAKNLIELAQKAMDEENYELAIQKYEEAIALCPHYESWKRERNFAQKLLKSRVAPPVPEEDNLSSLEPLQPPTIHDVPSVPEPVAPGAAIQRFQKMTAQAKGYYQKFVEYDKEYPTATPERQKQIKEEVQKLAETIQTFKAPMLAAAKAALKEAPNQDEEVTSFLINNVVMMVNYDDYENALKECDELINLGLVNQPIVEIAAFSSFNSNQFAYSESAIDSVKKLAAAALQRARKQGKTQAEITKDGIGQINPGLADLEKDLPYYKAAWAKEKALRQASSQAKDCPIVKLQTSAGDITFELFAKEAPNTVANFIELVNKGFYNGLTFHRVMQAFMAQGGDPNGDGSGGPGYCIPCEVDNPNARIHFRGSLSMANAGKDTGGSQFFITFRPARWLDGKHTVFGRVVSGLDVLAKIQRDPDPNVNGSEPTKIFKAEVIYMPPQLRLPPVKKLPKK